MNVERLNQVVVNAKLDRLDGDFRRANGGHQSDRQPRLGMVEHAHALKSRNAWQAQIRQHRVEGLGRGPAQPIVALAGPFDFIALGFKVPAQAETDAGLLFDQ